MFLKRALVTLILGPLALVVIYFGGPVYVILISGILLLATIEYARMMQLLQRSISLWVLMPLVLLQWIVGQWASLQSSVPALAVGIFVAMVYALWLYERNKSNQVTADWMAMIGGVMLMGWLGGHFFLIRSLPQNAWQWTMLAMLGTWIADSGAYLVGKFLAGKIILGRHPLSPRLSPNKTIEGYLGGVFFAVIVVGIVAYYIEFSLVAALILAIIVSAISPLGDLAISLLKREANVKDSGTMLPGHGGALDRIDSLIWSVTMGYYLALLIG
ncbi:MAG: hypothetical protein DWQ04_21755 [Chloroflexi bacterium]|nr:MAG: hypothetical protein DWQ04_21755 [Chloroflexota bacterium]